MYVKEMKNYTEYYNYQNDRSGLGHNQNKVIVTKTINNE
jgi:hypothetical protein